MATNATVKEEAQNFLNQFMPHVQFVQDIKNGGWSLPDRNGNMQHIKGTHSNVYNMIASARYAGFSDEASIKEINSTLEAFAQAMQSGDEVKIMELYQKMSARHENAKTKSVEEKATMKGWGFYNVGSLKSYGIEKTEPYLQGQMDLFAPVMSEMANRLAAYGRWKYANETGDFTKNSLLDYLLIQSDSRLVDLARWNTNLPVNQSLDSWFMYNEANKSFGQKTITDRYGNVVDTLTPTENAQRLIDTFNVFKEKWSEFNPKQQQQWQELYDYLQTHSQIAAEFVKKNTDDMLQNMAAQTPVTMGFETIGGQMYLTAKAAGTTTYVNMGEAPYLYGWLSGNNTYDPTDMFGIKSKILKAPPTQTPYKPGYSPESQSSKDDKTAYTPNNVRIHTTGPLVNIDASAVAQIGDITNVEKFGTMLAEYLQSAYS